MTLSVSLRGAAAFALVLCGFSGTTAWAEETIDPRQAVRLALGNNGELNALRARRGVHEAGETRATLFPNPVFEADLASGKLTGSPFENSLSVGISQEFPTAGKRQKRLEVARQELQGFDHQVDNSGRLLTEEVKTTFYDLILAQQRVALAGRTTALCKELLEVAKQRFEAGDIPEFEVNLAGVELARSRGRQAEAERDLFPAKAKLLSLLGPAAPAAAEFVGSLEGSARSFQLAQLKQLALARRPDFKALASEKAKGEAEVTLARAERIPNITAGIGYQRQNTAIEVAGNEVKSRDDLIALKLSVPLPFFDRNQSGVHEAVARRGSAETRYLAARSTIEQEVEGAYARLTSADKSVSVYAKDVLPQLEENLRLIQEAYRLGEVGILTVIEEQKKFFEVSDGYLNALYQRQTALARLEAAVGAELNQAKTGGEQ